MSQQQAYPSYQQQSSDPISASRSPDHNSERRSLTGNDASTSSPVRRNISNLSLEESVASSISVKGLGPIPKIKGYKKWLAGITAFFVLLSLVLRGQRDGANADADTTTDAPPSFTTSESEDGSGVHSCGSFFQPMAIMNLKHDSTIENVEKGAVASDNKVCSLMGTAIMEKHDGNAVDAAVATTLCLGVVNPASSGIGGGAFILVHSDINHHLGKINHKEYREPKLIDLRDSDVVKEGQTRRPMHDERRTKQSKKITEFIDGRETAPADSTYDMFEQLPHAASVNGGLAVATPGELRGLEVLHSRHGRLEWSEVVKPAMELAANGFEVTEHLAHDIEHHGKRYAEDYPNLGKLLTRNGDGKSWYKEGDICKRPEYAATLRAVMKDGADAIYKGPIAEAIAGDIQEAGGIITEDDLAKYHPVLRDPLVAHDVGGFTMVGAPPPSSGGAAVIGAARFLTGYNDSIATFPDTLSKHRLVEAFKHVFSIRMSMSDPAYSDDTHDAAKDMVEGTYMDKLREATLDHGVLPLSEYGGKKWCQVKDESEGNYKDVAEDAHEGDRRRRLRLFNYLEDRGTTHLAVVDKDRNAVSITSTVNTYFGSKVVSPSTGIVFNDEMDDFSTPGRPNLFGLPPSKANYIAPGKRPLSSMSPTLVFRRDLDGEETGDNDLGKLFMTLGSSGGPKIITAVTQVFVNHALLGMPLFSAVSNPRIHDQLLYHDAVVTTYDKCPLLQGPVIEATNRTRTALKKRGHKILPVDYLGTTQAIAVDLETDELTAVSDIRKVGTPAGY